MRRSDVATDFPRAVSLSRLLAGTSRSGVPLHCTLACGFANTRDYLVRCIEERVVGVDECLTEIASTDPCQERQQASLRS